MSSAQSTVLQLLAVLGVVVVVATLVAGNDDRTRGRMFREKQPARQVAPVRSPVRPLAPVRAPSPQVKLTPSRYDLRAAKPVAVKPVAKPSHPDAIIFPTDEPPTTTTSSYSNKIGDDQIPLDVWREIYKIRDPDEFINKFGSQGRAPGSITGRSNRTLLTAGVSLRERTIGIPYAIQAVCTPQPTTVAFDLDNEPYVTYFPACTRLERCGGCCPHHLLECAATKSETVTLQVLKTRYLGPGVNKFDIAEPVVVELDRHLECQCQCRVQASHCSMQQVYRPNECRCECLNQAEAAACAEADKYWDAGGCVCRCREHIQCSTGFHFNKDTCTCDLSRVSRKSPVVGRPSTGFRDFDGDFD